MIFLAQFRDEEMITNWSDRMSQVLEEAERRIIAKMIYSGRVVWREHSWGSERHRIIFSALEMLEQYGEPIDLFSVAQKLIDLEKLESVGGAQYLLKIMREA